MDESEINAVLDDSYNFSEVDDDILDPDFIVNNNYAQVNLLSGVTPFSSSDSEEDVPINSENIEDHNLEATNNEFENERIITEDLDIEYNEPPNEESTPIGKKRTKSPSRWKRNISKLQRAQGNGTISLRNKVIKKRQTGPNCKCKLGCFEKFTVEEKNCLLSVFNTIGDKQKQDTFLGGLISIYDVLRRRPRKKNNKSNRSCSCSYKVRLDGIKETIVCKQAFCSLFGVGKATVERIVSKIKSNNPSPKDLRGKHLNRPNKLSDQSTFQIRSHINSFPKYISHYSRMDNGQKKYLSPELSVKKMYEMYLEKYEHDFLERKSKGEQCKPTVKYDFYWNYFNNNFNLSFSTPKSDTCQTCDRLQNLINAENDNLIKKSLLDEKKIHLDKAAVFYSDLKEISKEAKTNPTVEVLSFDYQQNMPVPHIPSGDVFYKRQI